MPTTMPTLLGRAHVIPAKADDNPDAYLCIDSDDTPGIVIRIGRKEDIQELEAFADALNHWAGR